jgi:hypothetical protein
MRYRYTFNAVSRSELVCDVQFRHGNLLFRLKQKARQFNSLIIETESEPIPAELLRAPAVTNPPTVTVPPDPFFSHVLEQVRAIRGALSLWGVLDIDVDGVLREFLPDSEEERKANLLPSGAVGFIDWLDALFCST